MKIRIKLITVSLLLSVTSWAVNASTTSGKYPDQDSFMSAVASGEVQKILSGPDGPPGSAKSNLWRSIVGIMEMNYGLPKPPLDAAGEVLPDNDYFNRVQTCLGYVRGQALTMIQNAGAGRPTFGSKTIQDKLEYVNGGCVADSPVVPAFNQFYADYRTALASTVGPRPEASTKVSEAEESYDEQAVGQQPIENIANSHHEDVAPTPASQEANASLDATFPQPANPSQSPAVGEEETAASSLAAALSGDIPEPIKEDIKKVTGIGFLILLATIVALGIRGIMLGLNTKVIFYSSGSDIFKTCMLAVLGFAVALLPTLVIKNNDVLVNALSLLLLPIGIYLVLRHSRTVDPLMSTFDALCVACGKSILLILALAQLGRGTNPKNTERENLNERVTGVVILAVIGYLVSRLINRNKYFAVKLAERFGIRLSKSNLADVENWLEEHLDGEVNHDNFEEVYKLFVKELSIDERNVEVAA